MPSLVVVGLEGVFRLQRFRRNLADGLDHGDRGAGLEDVAAHVRRGNAYFDRGYAIVRASS